MGYGFTGTGTVQDGNIQGKTIITQSLMDESTCPWCADWYKGKVAESRGNTDDFRLYYMENTMHGDVAWLENNMVTNYLGALQQALLDVSAWVEKGIEPLPDTEYRYENGQIYVPDNAKERRGMQPVVTLTANGETCLHVKAGEPVKLEAKALLPQGAGYISEVRFAPEELREFPSMADQKALKRLSCRERFRGDRRGWPCRGEGGVHLYLYRAGNPFCLRAGAVHQKRKEGRHLYPGKKYRKSKDHRRIKEKDMKLYTNRRNPVLPPDWHMPDSEAHVMPDGKLYLYGSFDDGKHIYCSSRYHVVSTPDMEHWTIHDCSFDSSRISWAWDPASPRYPGIDWEHPSPFIQKMMREKPEAHPDLVKEEKPEEEQDLDSEGRKLHLLYAPDGIEKNGKYYLYFCMDDDREGVAVSDRPEGPFDGAVQLPCGGIDPAVFVDDDGQAYYYWGQINAHGVKLHEDMMSFCREDVVDNLVTEEQHYFHEGSSVRKIGDTYYYVFADVERGKPTSLGYATGKSPLGPFTYRGIIIDNADCDPDSWNNHGSIECFNGQWYVFYHRSSRGTESFRRLCVEPITINPDGSIDEVKMTSQGAGEPFGPGEEIMGYQACGLKGTVRIAPDKDGCDRLMEISDGDEAVFRYVKSGSGFAALHLKASGSGTVEVFLDGKSAGAIRITDGQQEKTEISAEAGCREAVLKFSETEHLEIRSLSFG